MNSKGLSSYLDGTELYGNDFDEKQIREWFEDEKEGYSSLIRFGDSREYSYHTMNIMYGYRFLPNKIYKHVLGMGGADAEEFRPILDKIHEMTVVEPTDYSVNKFDRICLHYIKPSVDGSLPFENNSFDLITCLSVLHHIANVSKVLCEIHRCCRPSGYILIREPIVSMREPIRSMNDWMKSRKGLTKRERGIPINFFQQLITKLKLRVINEQICMFIVLNKLNSILRGSLYKSRFVLYLDNILCHMFRRNIRYHTYNRFNRLRPSTVFYVLQKQQC